MRSRSVLPLVVAVFLVAACNSDPAAPETIRADNGAAGTSGGGGASTNGGSGGSASQGVGGEPGGKVAPVVAPSMGLG